MEKGNSTIGLLNLFLIAFSFFIAYLSPITTFVLAYAILGPLHYLTQLNWLNKRSLFKDNKRLKLTIILAGLFSTAFFLVEAYGNWNIDWYFGRNVLAAIVVFSVLATLLSHIKLNRTTQLLLIIPVVLTIILFRSNIVYLILFGVLFVSVIHVYLFTLLHMISGYVKNRSKIDLGNSLLMILVPLTILIFPWTSTETQNELINQNQYINGLTQNLSYLLGYRNLEVNSVVLLKTSWFVAFSYLYHYLNWFSKTKIIHWNDGLTKKKTIIICSVSLVFSAIYLLGFEYGLVASLFLSYLHVFAELPLNYMSIKHISDWMTKR